MKLVIVESPTKAKTISKFLGKTFTVKSSFGHIRDLPKKEMGIDIERDFKPKYITIPKAAERVNELKRLAQKAEDIILATDEDREGEAITWHLATALKLKRDQVKRIVFHEITKSAIEKALENPRKIDLNLVDAQQARRVLDRLVGYELSPFLWKKIRRGLSAGRVQSVALRIIVEREREIENFKSKNFWVIFADLKKKESLKNQAFTCELIEKNGKKIEETLVLKFFAGEYKIKTTVISDQAIADAITCELQKSQCEVADISAKVTQRVPSPPFTTSTLQQAAINQLGYSAKQTMMIAQKLYEEGHITYMRTDSVSLSLPSMIQAQKYIQEKFGKDYTLPSPRFYKTKNKGAQEAHEAIRPTFPEKDPESLKSSLENRNYRLYKLIWERMIACQMQSAVFDSVKIDVKADHSSSKNTYLLRANGSTLKFDGYLRVYGKKDLQTENVIPKLEIGDPLELDNARSEQKSTSPPPRYNEATLVKVLEENEIGRPSTYAPTISTIIERNYVDKNEEKRLYPLEIGKLVNDLLVDHFPEIVDIKFTANIENDFDEIAQGNKDWVKIIKEFYHPFHKNLAQKTKEVKKEDFQEKLNRNCPTCGGELVAKFGRFGKFIACSNYPECRHTEKTGEEKKMEEEYAGETCEICGKKMVVKTGRYGTFLGCSGYPDCKNIKKIEKKTGVNCPKCEKGEVVERKSKRGKIFFGCNTYPKCDFALWNKPNGEKCPQCGSLLVFAGKNKIKCSSKECQFEK